MPDTKLSEIISLVINGDIVIIPTESAYCYAADPFNKTAVEKLKELNNSQTTKQDIKILIGDLNDVPNLLESIEPFEEQKAIELWPSENSITFQNPSKWLSKDLLNKDKHLALRLPSEEFILEILHNIGQPLAIIPIYKNETIVRDSLYLKNCELPYLKVPHTLIKR